MWGNAIETLLAKGLHYLMGQAHKIDQNQIKEDGGWAAAAQGIEDPFSIDLKPFHKWEQISSICMAKTFLSQRHIPTAIV